MRFVRTFERRCLAAVIATVLPATLAAQDADSVRLSPNYWPRFTAGAATSVLLHESAHIAAALIIGNSPTFGFDKLRPTIYSGIDSHLEPHKQFLFSAAGLTVQSLIDEGILDIPHSRGGAFERGMLAGGIGTTVFYLTIGRRGSVSDIEFMARMHGMTRTQSSLLFGGISALHTIRIARNKHYAHFFIRPSVDGRTQVGLDIAPPSS